MNIQKFTQKSIEAINGCEKIAMEYSGTGAGASFNGADASGEWSDSFID